jgi:hypothetical protein
VSGGYYKNIIIVQVQQQWRQGMRCTFTIRTTMAPGYALYIYKLQDKKSQFKFCILTKHIGQKVTGQKVTT